MPKPYVYLTRRPPQVVLDILSQDCEIALWDHAETPVPRAELLKAVANADGILSLLTERIDAELLDAAPKLRVVANMAAGYDNVDLPTLTQRGVLLTNTPGVLTETTADLAWALMFAAARRVVEGQKQIEANAWGAWHPMYMVGQDIFGATLGVVGAGRIGAAVLQRAKGFNMRLLYHNRRPNSELEQATGAAYRSLNALLGEADFVVVTVPLSAETRNMFGAEQFALMKPNSVFVNIARGAVVNEAELAAALAQGRPWAAGLDVFAQEPINSSHPLLALPNVVALPHIGSASIATRLRMASLAAENLRAALTDQPIPTPVNPEVLPLRTK